jgi:hypothetical protein
MGSNITFRHRYSLSQASALLLILAQFALLIPGSLSTSPRTGQIVLSRVTQAAATQATISFETFASVPSGGSITLQFPFGRYGNGTTSLLGVMHGPSINVQGNGEKAVEAVNLLSDGVTVVYMTQDGGLTKVVSLDPYTNKNYTGSISQFNPTQWNTYNGGRTDPASAGYLLKDQTNPLDDYMPFIGSTGSCGVSSFSLGSASSSFVRNGNVIISMSASVPQGQNTVTCSGLTIFKTSSIFGGLRISTSEDPVPSVVKLECVTSDNTASHCAGMFKLGTSLVPMLYMVDGSFAWVAVKYTSNTSQAIVEDKWNSTHKNFYVSRNTLRSSISVATDILMVEGQSSVYANMTWSGFSRVRSNILGGCSWFTDTHYGESLISYSVMAPFASGAQVPDAGRANPCLTSLSYRCCSQSACTSGSDSPVFGGCPAQYDCSAGIFNSCRDNRYSNTGLSRHFRMRSGDHRAELTHSIWFRVPLSLLFVSAEFSIDASNRFAFKQNVPVTLAFFVTTDIPSGGRITLTYPFNFFASSVRPVVAAGASSVSGLSITCSTTSDTAVVLSTAGAVITTAFVVTISGFTMGAATPGSVGVTVQTSSDPSPSFPLPSGAIFGAVGNGAVVALSSYIYGTSATLTFSFVAAPSMNSTAFKLVSVTGLTFHSLNSSIAAVSCSNLSPSNASVSAFFTPSSGVLLLNLSEAASPVSPSAAIVCTVSGFRNQVCLRGQSGLSAKWYRNYNGLPLMSTTPSLQNAVPNLNFPLSTNDACSIMTLTSALNAYSGCMSNDFAAKFEGCGFSHIYLCLCVYKYILVCICICSYDVLTYVCFAAFHHCVVLPKF